MLRTILILGVVILMTLPASAEWQLSEFMIATNGHPTDTPAGNNASAQTILKANITVVMCPLEKLEVCRQYGLKAMIRPGKNDTPLTAEQAAQLQDDETVWGYFIMDEPAGVKQYEECAQRREALHKADPNHPSYVNLGGGYQKIHSRFIEIVKPEVLSYDYYHWWWDYDLHFPRLEEYRAAALDAGIPLIAWAECNTAKQDKIREYKYVHLADNLPRLRMSIYTRLAYGVKGILWWKGNQLWKDDQLTPVGQDAAVIGAEMKVLGPTLVKLRSQEVFHTPPLPRSTRQLPDDYWVQVAGEDWVLGVFKDPDNNDYLLLANRDHAKSKWAVLVILRPDVQIDKMDKTTGEWIALPIRTRGDDTVAEFIVAAGDGELLRLH